MTLLRRFGASELAELRNAFAAAQPFPHVVIDNCLVGDARERLSDFPPPSWAHWNLASEGYQKAKRSCADIKVIPSACAELIRECNEPEFLSTVERITGIGQLIADPYLEGGGLHASSEGGVLVPHTDFHHYERLHLFRVINLIIYLNEDWSEVDGGPLQLYRRGQRAPVVTITPSFGRAVIFKTDDQSIHGFSTPVAPGKWRKSVAIYYYTSRESVEFAGDGTTYWQSKGTRLKGMQLMAFQSLTWASRFVSKLAHKMDPNV
jgi:hypothetical protein